VLTIEIAGKGKSFIVFYKAHIEFYPSASQKIQIGLAHKCDQRLFWRKRKLQQQVMKKTWRYVFVYPHSSYFHWFFIYLMQEQVFSMIGENARKAIGASQDTAVLMSASFINIWNICFNTSA